MANPLIALVGRPNVGKSTFFNKVAGRRLSITEDRPGVTVDKQWVKTPYRLELLDMPGVLWPKFDDRYVAENLAMTGAIKDQILDVEELGCVLCGRLREAYPEFLIERYKLSEIPDCDNYDLLQLIGRKRGFLISGGEIDTERTSKMLLEEFRSAKIGRITLDTL